MWRLWDAKTQNSILVTITRRKVSSLLPSYIMVILVLLQWTCDCSNCFFLWIFTLTWNCTKNTKTLPLPHPLPLNFIAGVKSKSNISMIATPVLKKAESVESCICYEWKFNCAIWGASCFLHSSRLNYVLPIGYQFLTSMIVHNCYYSNRD